MPTKVKSNISANIPAGILQTFLPSLLDIRNIYSQPCGIPTTLASVPAGHPHPSAGLFWMDKYLR